MTLAHANAEGPLIIIGGHEDKDGDKVILKAVAERLKGGRLVIATVASHHPEGSFETYHKAFEPLGIKELVELYVEDRAEAHDPEIKAVTTIFSYDITAEKGGLQVAVSDYVVNDTHASPWSRPQGPSGTRTA